jgi:5-methylcytosine-specific restriction endonuclease McrA
MPRNRLKLPTVPVEFSCFNCDGKFIIIGQPKLFCSEGCQQEASFVRYYRNCNSRGTLALPDIQMAFMTRMLHILNGGYKQGSRRIPLATRKQVYERDKEKCQKCGNPGREVDHIEGGSNSINNLQVLCQVCHIEKTKANFKPITTKMSGTDYRNAKIAKLRSRTESKLPKRICDDEEHWNTNQKIILADMRRALYNERFLELGRNEGIDISKLEKELVGTRSMWIDKIVTKF